MRPSRSQSVQDEIVFQREGAGIEHSFIGVGHGAVTGDARGFVTNDAGAVLTCRVDGVFVSVIPARNLDCARYSYSRFAVYPGSLESVRVKRFTRATMNESPAQSL